jgi:hypothetical protein
MSGMREMKTEAETLEAELRAIDLWDRLSAECQQPGEMDKDASRARFFRRLQLIMQLEGLAAHRKPQPGGADSRKRPAVLGS